MKPPLTFEVVPATERPERPRGNNSNKYGPMFDAVLRGETVRVTLDGRRADDAIRATWRIHGHRATLHILKDGNGTSVVWADPE